MKIKRHIVIFSFFFLLQSCMSTVSPQNDVQRSSEINARMGLLYLEKGDLIRSKEKLLKSLHEDQYNPEAQIAMGYYFLSLGEFQQAKTYYDRALKLVPQSGVIQNHYGVFLCKTGHYRKAILHFIQATQINDYLYAASAYENAGLCALKIPDQKLAKQYFLKASELDPKRSSSLRD